MFKYYIDELRLFKGLIPCIKCVDQGFLSFCRPGATFVLCRLAGRTVINEDNLLKRYEILLNMLLS
jgi:hypothetical protein